MSVLIAAKTICISISQQKEEKKKKKKKKKNPGQPPGIEPRASCFTCILYMYILIDSGVYVANNFSVAGDNVLDC